MDVVFYTPFVGALLSRAQTLPPGGAETQILVLARTLARQGLRVAIIVYGAPGELPDDVDGVRILARPPPGKRRLVGKVVEAARIWQALWRCPSRAVVYRCAGLHLGLIALYTRATGRRLIFSSANVVDFDFKQLVSKRRDAILYRLGVRLADAIVVQTDEQVDLCRRAFRRESTCIHSLSMVDATAAPAPEAFLWVGRLVSYKRPLEYVRLAAAVPEARFWMVGVPAPHEAQGLRVDDALTEAAAAVPNLELLPPRTHAGIQQLMARAVASVNTADFEGMPNVLLEAWSRGVPALVLTHDPGGVVTTHGLGGFADGSPVRLAELAREQWRARNDRGEISERCRAYIEAHHSPAAIARQWISVLGLDAPGSPSVGEDRPLELTCAE